MGNETVAQRKHFAPIDRCRSRRLHFVERRKFQLGLPCSLYPRKRTLVPHVGMSALCQKRTYAVQQKEVIQLGRPRGRATAAGWSGRGLLRSLG